ncbi:hypothetical protein KFL_002050030 [Klebsormidium nitens]|uniref:Uncharacterized protein n=1 Tax=Klebsormidium nitens TaxID=105231 RepID=A0A1Y1I6K2_KLENI|nr:hypothetical protein KFL_002050030 [Klebsormidium nitens]|eukprot:GAQ84761.1 hypothetical protein KFL_002050030 [Klebsormidium nitens]
MALEQVYKWFEWSQADFTQEDMRQADVASETHSGRESVRRWSSLPPSFAIFGQPILSAQLAAAIFITMEPGPLSLQRRAPVCHYTVCRTSQAVGGRARAFITSPVRYSQRDGQSGACREATGSRSEAEWPRADGTDRLRPCAHRDGLAGPADSGMTKRGALQRNEPVKDKATADPARDKAVQNPLAFTETSQGLGATSERIGFTMATAFFPTTPLRMLLKILALLGAAQGALAQYSCSSLSDRRLSGNACPLVGYVALSPQALRRIACVYDIPNASPYNIVTCEYDVRSGKVMDLGVEPLCPDALVPFPKPTAPLLPSPSPTPTSTLANGPTVCQAGVTCASCLTGCDTNWNCSPGYNCAGGCGGAPPPTSVLKQGFKGICLPNCGTQPNATSGC